MNANRGHRGGFVFGTVLAFALATLGSPTVVRAAARKITDLGTLGGATAFARDINEPGQIVGESTTASGQTHAFLITPWLASGRMVDLGTIGGTFSQAISISNRGQVVGTSTLSGETQTRAFLWDQGKMTALPPLNGAMFSEGLDVNDAGTVVGDSNGIAVSWQNGRVHVIGTLGGGSAFATGINSSGVIIGNGATPSGDFHGWVFKNGVMMQLVGLEATVRHRVLGDTRAVVDDLSLTGAALSIAGGATKSGLILIGDRLEQIQSCVAAPCSATATLTCAMSPSVETT